MLEHILADPDLAVSALRLLVRPLGNAYRCRLIVWQRCRGQASVELLSMLCVSGGPSGKMILGGNVVGLGWAL
jgi:hypothetical protein